MKNGVVLTGGVGDEARGHERGRLVGVELEDGGGHNGKWSIFCAIRRRTEQYVR